MLTWLGANPPSPMVAANNHIFVFAAVTATQKPLLHFTPSTGHVPTLLNIVSIFDWWVGWMPFSRNIELTHCSELELGTIGPSVTKRSRTWARQLLRARQTFLIHQIAWWWWWWDCSVKAFRATEIVFFWPTTTFPHQLPTLTPLFPLHIISLRLPQREIFRITFSSQLHWWKPEVTPPRSMRWIPQRNVKQNETNMGLHFINENRALSLKRIQQQKRECNTEQDWGRDWVVWSRQA